MADLCQQCSIEIYGEDSRDLANLDPSTIPTVCGAFSVLCEGCGVTLVDSKGRCLIHDHDAVEAQIHQEIGI